ncbi:MAG: ABC transporter permease [Gammaproteobacteria bacterium]|nr:ABC transporter permease [Gammaproteobacteria bacterium]
MRHPIFTIARYTFLEAVRNRLFGLTIVGLVCLLGLTEFVGELAITETREVQAALIGAGMRLFAVCTVSLFVITSMVREFNDKGFELILSMPVPRYGYFFGKFIGFLLLSAVIAVAIGALLLIYSPPAAIALWLFSLECELAILISVSLLCLFTFGNVTVAFVLVLAFYLLGRSLYAIQLISASPILESTNFSQEFMNRLLEGIAFVLPGFHDFTRSEWLIYGGGWSDAGTVAAQTLIYTALLCTAALFDLYRKDL